jgi:hypothetical protein
MQFANGDLSTFGIERTAVFLAPPIKLFSSELPD